MTNKVATVMRHQAKKRKLRLCQYGGCKRKPKKRPTFPFRTYKFCPTHQAWFRNYIKKPK